MDSSVNYHHYNKNRSGDLEYCSISNSSDDNSEISCIRAPSTAQILFHSNIESESSSSTIATNKSCPYIIERPLERYIMSPSIELEVGSNGVNNTNHLEMSENISSSNRWCTSSNNNNIFSQIINNSIVEKSRHEMCKLTNTTPHEPEVNALSSSATSLLRENDQMNYSHENKPNNTHDVNTDYTDSITKNTKYNSATNLHQDKDFTNYSKLKELEKSREEMPREYKNKNVSKTCSTNNMHINKNNKWCYKDQWSLNAEKANASPNVVHAKMFFEPVHSECKLSVIIPTRLRVPSLWFTNTTQSSNSNLTTFVKGDDKNNWENSHHFQTSLSPPMPSAKTKVEECEESYREHMHSPEVCDKQEACSKRINYINSSSRTSSNISSCSCNSKKRRRNNGRRSVSTIKFDKEKAFEQLVVSKCTERDDKQHSPLLNNSNSNASSINTSTNQSSKRNQKRYSRKEERNEEKEREYKHDNTYHNVHKNKINKPQNELKTLRLNSSNLSQAENEEHTTTRNNSDYKALHHTPKNRKEILENNKNLEKTINGNHYSSKVNAITAESSKNNKIIDVKSKMQERLPHELRKDEREIRRNKPINSTNSISVPNTTLHQNDTRADRHRLEISKPIASASVHNLPTTLALPYSTNTLEPKHLSVPPHVSNLTTLYSLPSAQTTLNTRASARLLASGDWFYKWSRDGSHVSPRWVWVDTRSHLLAWAHRETTSNMFSHSIPLEMIWQVTPRELVQPLWRGHEHRIYYVLQIQSTQRVLQIATQQKEKVDLWYEALVNVLSFVRRHDVNKSTSIPDEGHDVQILNTTRIQLNRM